MLIIQTVTLVAILLNLLLETSNAFSYRRRIHELESRVTALESMLLDFE